MDYGAEVSSVRASLIQTRRDLHKHPETGWLEYRTASIVASRLQANGYEVVTGPAACETASRMGVPTEDVLRHHERRAIEEGADPQWVQQMQGGHTAVVGILKGDAPGPVIALRFDMDSNDLTESIDEDHLPVDKGFASLHEGMMHACAHDGHTSIGLGVAEIVARHRDQLRGEVRLLFQPAEEGCRGAKSMVQAGWLDGVDYFFGGHIAVRSLKLGEVVASTSGFLATMKMDVEFYGHAAHAGGSPQEGRNALLAAATAALNLHAISRHGDGRSRVNVGRLEAGSGRNVIADYAKLQLETRGETQEINDYISARARQIIEGAALMHGVTGRITEVGEGQTAICSPSIIPHIERIAKQIAMVDSVVSSKLMGGSEDVTWMMNHVQLHGGQATYMMFGSPLPQGHHQPKFDFDENVLQIATEMFVRCIFTCPDW